MKPNVPDLKSRKTDHIRINLEEDVSSGLTTGLERWSFVHQALPEINLEDVHTDQILFGRKIDLPILISSMTGGTDEAGRINSTLARAAQEFGLAMGLGSMRAAVEHPEKSTTFKVRKHAPDILLFANLGAVQFNYGYDVAQCRRVVELAEADALVLHLNPLQEALQPEGDTHFSGLLKKIETICREIEVPVIIKEVGWGISADTALRLANTGVSAIDVAGAGGTSWSQVEMYRISDSIMARVAGAFRDWGIPTAESLRQVHAAIPDMTLFGSGGLRSGIDIAKCISLGARLGGMASPFLKAAVQGELPLRDEIMAVQAEIRVSMFAVGAADLQALRNTPLIQS
jgi:isopentenyl-diphosphate delta-isomerase